MDYSTISNKTNCTEIEDATGGEIAEKYYLLKKQYNSLSANYESIKQDLHDTRRSYQTAVDIQRHLTIELETFQGNQNNKSKELLNRISTLQEENTLLKQERAEEDERHDKYIKKIEVEMRQLKEENELKVFNNNYEKDNTESDELRASLVEAAQASEKFKCMLDEAQAEILNWKLKVQEQATEMAEMREASAFRKEEFNLVLERESTALAELAEAKAMLHHNEVQDLQPHAAKGNSIFAEVEDKRQEMAKTLIQMKQTNSRLRRDLANKQAELETLLHEKQNIWQQQTGATAEYDKELIENYEDRITQLEGMCERQRRELARWFGKLCEPTAQGWLPGVLDHLKSECENLRTEVLSRGAAQLVSAAQVRELRRKLALITANGGKSMSPIIEKITNNSHVKDEFWAPVANNQVRPTATIDDVKKKVSFN